MVKYNTKQTTSYQPNHSTPDTTGQNSNATAKPPADYVGAPHNTRKQRQTSSSENEEHTHNSNNEWQEIGAPTGKKVNTHLPTLWTLHQKYKIDTTFFLKRNSRKK